MPWPQAVPLASVAAVGIHARRIGSDYGSFFSASALVMPSANAITRIRATNFFMGLRSFLLNFNKKQGENG